MVDPTKITAELSTIRADLPVHLMDAQKQAAKFFSDFNELTSKTLRGILESQTELLRLEANQASKAFLLPKVSEDPGTALSGYLDDLHAQADRVIDQTRSLTDIWRNYGWGLLSLCACNYRKGLTSIAPNLPPDMR
ncbi:MAG: hypothetical protein P4L68_01625 [Methylovirgula sp.]|nr:hypothetical protein [Methylovirgula sp.]